MIKLKSTTHFEKNRKKYVKKNTFRAEKLLSALSIFRQNPSHPSLNLEKLINSDVWSIRLNRGDRLFFTWIDNETALLIDIGNHDTYRTVS